MLKAYLKKTLPPRSTARWIVAEMACDPLRFPFAFLRSWSASRTLTGLWWPIRVRLRPESKILIKVHSGAVIRLHANLTFHQWGGVDEVSSIFIEDNAALEIAGDFTIGPGVNITVSRDGSLFLGGRRQEAVSGITCRSRIMVEQSVHIGADSIIAWGVFIGDSDGHTIKGKDRCLPIRIEDHVWISHDVSVLKGAVIPHGCIVAPKSVVTARPYQPRSLLAGQPAVIKREGVEWSG